MNNTDLIKADAYSYFLAYTCLAREHSKFCMHNNSSLSIYVFPMITVAILSSELVLKSLLSKVHKTHDLYKLFLLLPQSLQQKYEDSTVLLVNFKMSKIKKNNELLITEGFLTELLKLKELFTQNRYFYENASSANLDFIEAFMFSLNNEDDAYKEFINNQLTHQDSLSSIDQSPIQLR